MTSDDFPTIPIDLKMHECLDRITARVRDRDALRSAWDHMSNRRVEDVEAYDAVFRTLCDEIDGYLREVISRAQQALDKKKAKSPRLTRA